MHLLNSCLERFINDTVDYEVHYVGVDSLDEECIECRRYSDYCEYILPDLWIDDDFLNDEKLAFDYEKFELIDAGVKYLNPKHFSVKNFVMYCRFGKEWDYGIIKDICITYEIIMQRVEKYNDETGNVIKKYYENTKFLL